MKLANVPDTSAARAPAAPHSRLVARSSEPPATSAPSGREPPPPAAERESLLLAALQRDVAVVRRRERAQAKLGPRGKPLPGGPDGLLRHRVDGNPKRMRALKRPRGLTTGHPPRQPQEGVRR